VSDFDLLERLRGGSQVAFETIFRTYYPRLVGTAESMLHDRAAAEEVAQEVMLELWRRRARLSVDTSLRAYLFRATRNRALNWIRHEQAARRAEPHGAPDPVAQPSAQNDLTQAEIDRAIREAMDELPPRCREVFELSRVHGLRYAEIAAALDISIKTVEAQMGKALRIVRERLTPWLPNAD
jgi:RNA polymerase sigma-19 factor, ECF subfamily